MVSRENWKNIPTLELNNLLGHFAIKVRKANGKDYEPNSLTSFFRSFDRHLKNKGQQRSILFDRDFETSRQVLEARRKELRKQGMGKKENAAEPISKTEENQLWESKQLGDSNPYALLQTVWYFNTMQFGWRGCDEHHRVSKIHEVNGIKSWNHRNHSARKTMVTRLIQNNVRPLHVAQLMSGHKNLKSLDSYSVASEQQQRTVSKIITGDTATTGKPLLADITNTTTSLSGGQSSSSASNISCSAEFGLPGFNITGNVVNVYVQQTIPEAQVQRPQKRRRIAFIDSDDEF